MGDARFDAIYEQLSDAPDRASAIARLDDEALVQALAAASKRNDPYLANVLATSVLNRMQRARALFAALIVGAIVVIVTRTIAMGAWAASPRNQSDLLVFVLTSLVLALGLLVAGGVYVWGLRRLRGGGLRFWRRARRGPL